MRELIKLKDRQIEESIMNSDNDKDKEMVEKL